MALGFWPITAMFFDGRGHNNKTGQESFFSIAHLFLYGGLTVLGLWITALVRALPGQGRCRRAPPDDRLRGHPPSATGSRLIGPRHAQPRRARPTSSGTASTGSRSASMPSTARPTSRSSSAACSCARPASRSMWAKEDIAPDLRRFAPVILSSILFIGVAGFITMYLSAFMTNVTPTTDFVDDLKRFNDVRLGPEHQRERGPGRLRGTTSGRTTSTAPSHGMASMIVTTLILLGPTLLMLRRWRVPVRGRDADLPRLRAAREHHDRVPRHRPDRAAARRRPSPSTSCSSDSGASGRTGRVSLGGIRVIGPAAAAVLWLTYYGRAGARQGASAGSRRCGSER